MEIQTAIQDGGLQKLFPIRLTTISKLERWKCVDPTSGVNLADKVLQYHIPDFSGWKDDDTFEVSFESLMRDLRRAAANPLPRPGGVARKVSRGSKGTPRARVR